MMSSSHVRRQGREVEQRLERESVDDGRARKERRQPLRGEFQGPRAVRQDDVEAKTAILVDDVIEELLPACVPGEALEIQKLIVEHDACARLGLNDGAQRV